MSGADHGWIVTGIYTGFFMLIPLSQILVHWQGAVLQSELSGFKSELLLSLSMSVGPEYRKTQAPRETGC